MSLDWGLDGVSAPPAPKEDPNGPDGEYPGRWHVPPRYRQSLCWVSGSKCRVCKTTGLYEDMHPVCPCPRCGERIKEVTVRWIPDTDTWWPWLTRYKRGHWEER